jgi:hypothetical protein
LLLRKTKGGEMASPPFLFAKPKPYPQDLLRHFRFITIASLLPTATALPNTVAEFHQSGGKWPDFGHLSRTVLLDNHYIFQ